MIIWIIHESSLPQMVGTVGEAVVFHREPAGTPQMW